MSFFSEVKTVYQFFQKTPLSEKRIVFYAEHAGYYPYFEGLINELTIRHKATVSYITSDPRDPVLTVDNSYLRPFYINTLLPFFMRLVDAKVFVMTLTDLNHFHLKRSCNPVHYVYVFHALVSTTMAYREGSFDYYDTVFCAGPHQIEEIRRYEELKKLKQKKLVEAGYYRLERIYEAYKKRSFSSRPGSKKTVLIAPSWGKSNIFEFCGEELIAILLRAGYSVIARPHPETIKRTPELISRLESQFSNHREFTLEKSVAGDDSLLKADVLISDCSGIFFEYAFGTERPVLFIDVPPKVKNPRFKEVGIQPLELALRPKVGVIISPDILRTVPKVLEELIASKDSFQKTIIELRNKHVFAFGESSKIGAQYILNLLGPD